jgi:ABC-type phosphate/phosphonate transport system substrate-binding protein
MGTSPEAFLARSVFTYGHRNVVRAVASGLAQSGSVDGYVWEALTVAEPSLPAATRVVARSEWLGFPPIACLRDRADSPRMRALADALERMGESPQGRAVLAMLQLDGFSQAEPDLFDGIAALARTVDERG